MLERFKALQLRRLVGTLASALVVSVIGVIVFGILTRYPADEVPIATAVVCVTWIVVFEAILFLSVANGKVFLNRFRKVGKTLDINVEERSEHASANAIRLALLMLIAFLLLVSGGAILLSSLILVAMFGHSELPGTVVATGNWMLGIGVASHFIYLVASWGTLIIGESLVSKRSGYTGTAQHILQLSTTLLGGLANRRLIDGYHLLMPWATR